MFVVCDTKSNKAVFVTEKVSCSGSQVAACERVKKKFIVKSCQGGGEGAIIAVDKRQEKGPSMPLLLDLRYCEYRS